MKAIRRGNRVSTVWFLLAGLILLTIGLVLLAGLSAIDPDSLDRVFEEEFAVRLVAGILCTALGAFSLQIWVIAFAITVGLVETNRRLERLEHLPSMDWYAEQSHAALSVPPGLRSSSQH